ncbi:type II toxin-antitoxin system Phd/YefM family antitoxin [Patescibacteria group bacterium]|nr:type II toxin-antitoxin system Phd/YefM family antitoxin [Patescibacteria group bacterium]MBU1472345.1 type II toxin-antitoxin system Phd/YefM family antitoxin [Patescibacteria group bacterium]MBU2460403.1 type II toxin-antitoxin system Phd/YefM family antitoxin [Patescibacteria group bacterium]MBU2544216.1 type II toxin-antitoxin system Phd/YefM family antitoxin [Patescibacteria group bacterium]
MNTLAISDVRANLPSLVDKVDKYMDRILITVNGKPKAAMLSMKELEALEETAEILTIPGALESIKKGVDDVKRGRLISFSELKKKYK